MLRRPTADRTRINHQIREREVRVIDHNEQHVGVIPLSQALGLAEQAGLDLVEVATKARPHVCRIMDYGQYKYEQSKRKKEARKKQKQVIVKEVQIRPRTDEHDYNVKLERTRNFLQHGFKVRLLCRFRGRENAHREIGREKIDRLTTDLAGFGVQEFTPRMEGRNLLTVYSPDPTMLKKIEEEKRAQAKEQSRRGEKVPGDRDGKGQTEQGGEESHPEQENPQT